MMKEFSVLYQQMGMFISAYELLSEVELFEEAIKCLYIGGRKTQAIKYAEKFLKETLAQPVQ